jgi:hypothetical protein
MMLPYAVHPANQARASETSVFLATKKSRMAGSFVIGMLSVLVAFILQYRYFCSLWGLYGSGGIPTNRTLMSASFADSFDDSSDVSSRELSMSEVIAAKHACSTSMTAPREDKDSLCLDRRAFFLETVL